MSLILFLIEVELIYNIVLVSVYSKVIQLHIHIYVFRLISHMCMCALTCVQLFATLWTKALHVLIPNVRLYLLGGLLPGVRHFPSKNTGVGSHFLLQRIFPTQGSNLHHLHLLHWQADSLPTGLNLESFSIKKQTYASWVSIALVARGGTCISYFLYLLE